MDTPLKQANHKLSTGRHGGWLPDRPSHKDWFLSKKLDTTTAVPENPSLPPASFPKMRDQGNQGSCTGHMIRNVLMQRLLDRDLKKWSKYDLSPASGYYNARKIEKNIRQDSGAFIRNVFNGAGEWGIAREDHAPYRPDRLLVRLSSQAEQSAKWHQAIKFYRCDEPGASSEKTVDNMLRALGAGLPLGLGFGCFTNLNLADADGIIRLPGPHDDEDGGHAIACYGADTRERMFWGPNSWGPWGAKGPDRQLGYWRMTFEYVLKRLADDIWAGDHEPT